MYILDKMEEEQQKIPPPLRNDFEKKDIYIVGDIEGAFPFENAPDDLPFKKDGNKIDIELNADKALIFTGDLIDKGKYDIRWLQAMLKAKKKNPYGVLLTIGNRDINKIHLLKKCFLVKKKKNANDKYIYSFPWEGYQGTFEELCHEIANNNTGVYEFANFNYKPSTSKKNVKGSS